MTDPKTLCCRLAEVILVCFDLLPKFYIYTIVPIILLYFLPVLVYNSVNFAYPEVLCLFMVQSNGFHNDILVQMYHVL